MLPDAGSDRLESINVVSYLGNLALEVENCYNIEPADLFLNSLFIKVRFGDFFYLALFCLGNPIFRLPVFEIPSVLHLDKYQIFPVSGDNINLTAAKAVILFNYLIADLFKETGCEIFSVITGPAFILLSPSQIIPRS
jgi:hypothetical protein